MDTGRTEDLKAGLRLIPALGEVMPGDADGRVARVYTSLRKTLRVPFVNFIFRVLAQRPDYLDAAWARLQPAVATFAFERASDALRANATLPIEAAPGSLAEKAGMDLDRIRAFTDSIHYVLPKLLLIATALDEGLVEAAADVPAPAASAAFPLGEAAGAEQIELLDPDEVGPPLDALFDDIRARHGHPGVASYYRALGHWPSFLEAVWGQVAPHVGTGPYEEQKQVLVAQAAAAAGGLALRGPSVAAAGQAAELRRILAVFRFRLIPDLLLDVTVVRGMLAGPDAAARSRFSVSDGSAGG